MACPQTNQPAGFCYNTDPLTQQLYNLTGLLTANGTAVTAGYGYTINTCGSVPCGGKTAGACFSVLSRTLDLGQPSGAVQLQNGLLSLHYTNGDVCFGTLINSSSIIYYICSPTQQAPVIYSVNLTSCVFIFNWYTPLACPNLVSTVSCSVGDYDLSPLINNQANWITTDTSQGGKYVYQINACRTLVPGNFNCSAGMAACQTTPFTSNEGDYDLGRVLSSPQINSNGQLYIQYVSGRVCGGTTASSTIINFVCPTDYAGNPILGVIGHPTFMYESAGCVYNFQWVTSFACPLSTFTGSSCQVIDSMRGNEYNLAPLISNNGNYVFNTTGGQFVLNICLNVNNNLCGSVSGSSGGCFINSTSGAISSLGIPSSAPTFNDGSLLLTYANGSKCSTPGFTMTSVIEFVCNPAATVGSPLSSPSLVEQDGCTFIFQWPTVLACPSAQVAECLYFDFPNHRYFDLSVLANPVENWMANHVTPSGTPVTFELNVCRTLVPNLNFPGCPGNAAACMITEGSYVFIEQSIGQVAGPALSSSGNVYLQYSSGVPCPTNPSVNSSTLITFICPKAGSPQGDPIFSNVNDQCQYQFTWTTSAACPISMNAATTTVSPSKLTCQAVDYTTGYVYDLSPLKPYTVTASIDPSSGIDPNTNVVLAVCTHTTNTLYSVAEIVDGTDINFGGYFIDPVVTDGSLSITYVNGAQCGSENEYMSSQIDFICNPTLATGNAVYYGMSIDNCTHYFTWETRYACTPGQLEIPCAFKDPLTGKDYDLTPLMR